MNMETGMERFRGKMRGIVLAAGILSGAALLLACVVPAFSGGTGHLAYAEEDVEAIPGETDVDAEAVSLSETEADTESAVFSGTIGEMTGFAREAIEAVDSLSPEEIQEYALMIERIVSNPDFQSLMQYEEVRELLVLLTRNTFNMAVDDPDLVAKVLDTAGVDRRLVFVLFEVLSVCNKNPEVSEQIKEYLNGTEGKELLDLITNNLDAETISGMMQSMMEYGKIMEAQSLQRISEQDDS